MLARMKMGDIGRLLKPAMLSYTSHSKCAGGVDSAERMPVLDEVYESALNTSFGSGTVD